MNHRLLSLLVVGLAAFLGYGSTCDHSAEYDFCDHSHYSELIAKATIVPDDHVKNRGDSLTAARGEKKGRTDQIAQPIRRLPFGLFDRNAAIFLVPYRITLPRTNEPYWVFLVPTIPLTGVMVRTGAGLNAHNFGLTS